MAKNAENVVQNIGAIAETTSIFYNAIAKQVPKDVALILTQHFMDISIARRPISAAQAAQNQRRLIDELRRQQDGQKTDKPPEENMQEQKNEE